MTPRLLDLFCGAGGAAMGYHRAGFEVVGVDIEPQPSYPFEFMQMDALDPALELWPFDAIHASPPCQGYGAATKYLVSRDAPLLIDPIRELLASSGKPYVIENVVGAPLREPITLCGSMFGLDVKRHRLFELSGFALLQPACNHGAWRNRYPTHARKDKAQFSPVVHIYGTGGGAGKDINLWRRVMEVPWMQTKAEISESIPPAYTEFIGEYLLGAVRSALAA